MNREPVPEDSPKPGDKGRIGRETAGTALAITAALISGLAIPANKIFVTGLDPTVFTAARALIIGIVFLAISLYTERSLPRPRKGRNWKHLLAIAVVGGAAAFLLFFTGLQLTTAGRGAFIHKMLPFFVAIFAFLFLKEKVSRKQWYALLVMLAGLVFMFSKSLSPAGLWLDPQMGDYLILGATVLWAIENTIARKAMLDDESNIVVSFSRMFIGGLILFGAVLLMGRLDALLSLTPWQATSLLASSAILLGYVYCWYKSISLINVSKASLFLLLAPVVSLILGVLVFAEPLVDYQLIGSALILAGAFFVVRIESRLDTGV